MFPDTIIYMKYCLSGIIDERPISVMLRVLNLNIFLLLRGVYKFNKI